MQEITSTKNAKIKHLIQLSKKSSYRKKEKAFIIEGIKEVEKALNNNIKINTIFFYPEFIDPEWLSLMQKKHPEIEWVKISKPVYEKLAYRKSTGGLIALAKQQEHKLQDLQFKENPLILIAEKIEKPGNIGAILRTADGAGVDAVILVNPQTDLYNPNVIRSSLGTIFSNQIAVVNDLKDLRNFLNHNNIQLFMATLQNANPYYKEDYTQSSAIAVGAEDKGLTEEFRNLGGKAVYIPMKGDADSLNVSVSAAILSYEALRQRENI
jgi:TrmH family RNA methyltransferase